MRVTVEVEQHDLVGMGVSEEQLEESIRNELSQLSIEGEVIYINDLDVDVVVL